MNSFTEFLISKGWDTAKADKYKEMYSQALLLIKDCNDLEQVDFTDHVYQTVLPFIRKNMKNVVVGNLVFAVLSDGLYWAEMGRQELNKQLYGGMFDLLKQSNPVK